MKKLLLFGVLAMLAIGSTARPAIAAEEAEGAHAAHPAVAEHADTLPHPQLSEDARWAGTMVIVIVGMFLAAAVVGTVVRANAPEELPPPAHSHDEPPGESHHHGHSGTHQPEPHADDHGHGH